MNTLTLPFTPPRLFEHAQVAALGSVVASSGGVVPSLGWSVDESLDTHQWKEGDWWRPAALDEDASIPRADDRASAGTLGSATGDVSDSDDAPFVAPPSAVPAARETRPETGDPAWKIVAFASRNYLAITERWYDRLTELGYTEHVVAAMDEALFDALAAKGYRVEDHVVSPSEKLEPGEPVPGWGRHLWKLWRYRLSYALRQTQLGRNVFLVDVDTMWTRYVPLRDLFDGAEREARADVFLSQGTVYPPDVFDKWGFVGCMGSAAFRATPAAQTLLRQAIRACAEGSSCDDQVAVNRALALKYDIRWDRDGGTGEGELGGDASSSSSAAAAARVAPDLGERANASVALRDGDATGHGVGTHDDASRVLPTVSIGSKVFEPRIVVRAWPKPFVFRSTMKDVRRVSDEQAAALARAPGAPRGAGTCLGQARSDVIDVAGNGDGNGVDFSRPFIVAPASAKDGEEKVEVWDKFQRWCFVIETEAFLRETLPSPGPPGRSAALPGKVREARETEDPETVRTRRVV